MLINAVGDWSHSNCRARLVDPTSRGYRWTTNGSLKSVTRISLLRTRFRSENRINITSQIGKFVEVSLLLADVPVQALSQRIEPVGDLVLGANGRHWVDGCCNPQTGEYEKHQLATKKNKKIRTSKLSFSFWSCVELRSGSKSRDGRFENGEQESEN